MKYKVDSIEVGASKTGKTVANVQLVDAEGKLYSKKVSIWGDFPGFQSITFGATVDGDIVVNDKGYATLYPPKPQHKFGSFAPRGASTMMKEKQEGIKESQGRKEDSIKTSSSMRDAVQIALAELGTLKDHTEYESRIQYWRKFLLDNWELPF